METIFDFNLTAEEIEDMGVFDSWINVRHNLVFPEPYTEQGYRETITPEGAILDLALLFDSRGETQRARVYWAQIPERAAEWGRGFDYEVTVV